MITDMAHLQRIEAAARAVLIHGQARYSAEERYVGDLVPGDVMIALASAVHGAVQVTEPPPEMRASHDWHRRRAEEAGTE